MSKFNVGDCVVCIDDDGSDLCEGKSYIISEVADYFGDVEYFLEGEAHLSWMGSRFESFEEWASHQRLASTENQLFLSQHQILILQKFKLEANYLLHHAMLHIEDDVSLKQEIEHFIVYGKLG